MTTKRRKSGRKKSGGRKPANGVKVVQAVQALAGAAIVAYRVIRPHLKKRKAKK